MIERTTATGRSPSRRLRLMLGAAFSASLLLCAIGTAPASATDSGWETAARSEQHLIITITNERMPLAGWPVQHANCLVIMTLKSNATVAKVGPRLNSTDPKCKPPVGFENWIFKRTLGTWEFIGAVSAGTRTCRMTRKVLPRISAALTMHGPCQDGITVG